MPLRSHPGPSTCGSDTASELLFLAGAVFMPRFPCPCFHHDPGFQPGSCSLVVDAILHLGSSPSRLLSLPLAQSHGWKFPPKGKARCKKRACWHKGRLSSVWSCTSWGGSVNFSLWLRPFSTRRIGGLHFLSKESCPAAYLIQSLCILC